MLRNPSSLPTLHWARSDSSISENLEEIHIGGIGGDTEAYDLILWLERIKAHISGNEERDGHEGLGKTAEIRERPPSKLRSLRISILSASQRICWEPGVARRIFRLGPSFDLLERNSSSTFHMRKKGQEAGKGSGGNLSIEFVLKRIRGGT